jgi:energy-coupling factor transport system permease protein
MSFYAQYIPGSSPIHRMDPRTKLTWLAVIYTVVLLFDHPFFVGLILLSVLLIAGLGRILRPCLKFLSPFGIFCVFIILVWTLIFPGQTPIVVIQSLNFSITVEAVLHGLGVAFRFLSLLAVTFVLISTTRIGDLLLASKKIGIPYTIGFLFASTVRFLPVLLDEFDTILDAQRSRGLRIEGPSIISRARNLLAVLVPLLLVSFKRVKLVGYALETRAFGASKERTFMRDLKPGRRDAVMLVFCATFLVTLVLLRLAGYGLVGGLRGLFPGFGPG